MKSLAKFLFIAYHLIFFPKYPSCRFYPTCSEYCLEAYFKYGILKGTITTAKRLLSCHPFSKKPFYDPVS